jgi:hypothetical protein
LLARFALSALRPCGQPKKQKADAIKTSHKIEAMLRVNFVPPEESELFDQKSLMLDTLLRDLSYEAGVDVTLPRLARIFYLEAWARSTSRKAKQGLKDIDAILAEGKSKIDRSKLRRMEARYIYETAE